MDEAECKRSRKSLMTGIMPAKPHSADFVLTEFRSLFGQNQRDNTASREEKKPLATNNTFN